MTSLALILLVAAVGHGVSRWLRIPVTPLLLLTGLGLAWSGWLPDDEAGVREDSFVLALAFALMVGSFFGVQPARRAARLRPVEALR